MAWKKGVWNVAYLNILQGSVTELSGHNFIDFNCHSGVHAMVHIQYTGARDIGQNHQDTKNQGLKVLHLDRFVAVSVKISLTGFSPHWTRFGLTLFCSSNQISLTSSTTFCQLKPLRRACQRFSLSSNTNRASERTRERTNERAVFWRENNAERFSDAQRSDEMNPQSWMLGRRAELGEGVLNR